MNADTLRSATNSYPSVAGMRFLMLVAVVASVALAGCTSRTARAPIVDMTVAPEAPPAVTGSTYVVKPGDTLFKISQASGVPVGRLERLNNITDPGQLRVGQVLRLDGPIPDQPATGPVVAEPVTPVPAVEPATSTQTARASDANLIDWGWPVSGKIIQGFNPTTKGIDIEGAMGDPVVAAADGKVMYAGNGVRGLGNLILLAHSNGFITAYAHNQELLVKTGDDVKKGAKIATLGQSDTTSPRLHFEVRRGGNPVNPLEYLPARNGT